MTAPDAPPASAESTRSASTVIWLLVGSAFVMILNETIMSVALPVLVTDLDVTVGTAQWLTSGFLLTMSVVIPITGYLLQRLTPRTVYLMAMSLFSAGTLISALAPGFGVLLVGRIVQALGTAVMIPLLMTSVIRLVPAEQRGAKMGVITLVIAVAPAIGPTISGIILSTLSWRWMFLIVLPIALIALAAGAVFLRLDGETRSIPLDWLSVVLSALAFGGIVFGLSTIGESARGEAHVPPWLPIVVGVLAMALFVMRQLALQRTGNPLLDLRPFTHRTFAVALALTVLGMMALFGVLILLPLVMQDVMGVSAFVTGLAVLPGGLVMGLLGPFVGRLYDRVGARPLVLPGVVVLALALWGFALVVGESTPVPLLIGLHILLVTGLSFMITPLMTDALGSLPSEIDSHGSAILATLQQVAGAAGTALFVTLMVVFASTPNVAADATGAHAAFLCAAIIGTAAIPVALLLGGKKPAAH
ncbi:DHA2 family efflux MFS transporter permease subunit [Pseudonocardia sp. WMMC193]|uniref:DHA2 family efflux MFS transporter permease subunit n=1 Tax=Pseudonocardia sp. WMMC193 TaxID=2911965 RepID=UPI001F031AA5|nr:DHA2 family efflux MFS transporter permease subunit [Pseudonocardia sp. WMMC193]MCF7547767.1 DHA2 family efflux MFS transporter permease subunit [Pseudonocardia sp. WMMC193]